MATDLKFFGNLDFGVIAGTQQRARLLQIAFVQRLGPAANSSPPASGLEPGVDPLAQYVALECRQGGEVMKGSLPARRRGIDVSVRECNSTPRPLSGTVVSTSWRRDRAKRSSSQTMTTSPLRVS